MQELTVGVDIGGTNTEIGLVDREGNCLASARLSTTDFATPAAFVEALARSITQRRATLGRNATVVGIGIGAPNGNYYNGTIELAPNLPWPGVIRLRDAFSKHVSEPVFVTNDANAAAIGEMLYGATKGIGDSIVVTLGTGVGSGFVSGGRLIYGHDGFAGELGHTIIEEDGRRCGCGRRGCLETYASATGFVRTSREMMKLGDADELSPEDVTEAAKRDDTTALAIFDFTAKKLAIGLANAVAITSPKRIVLFGGLARAGDLILAPTRRYLDRYLLNLYAGKVDLVTSGLADRNAAILGAAALAWQELG